MKIRIALFIYLIIMIIFMYFDYKKEHFGLTKIQLELIKKSEFEAIPPLKKEVLIIYEDGEVEWK